MVLCFFQYFGQVHVFTISLFFFQRLLLAFLVPVHDFSQLLIITSAIQQLVDNILPLPKAAKLHHLYTACH